MKKDKINEVASINNSYREKSSSINNNNNNNNNTNSNNNNNNSNLLYKRPRSAWASASRRANLDSLINNNNNDNNDLKNKKNTNNYGDRKGKNVSKSNENLNDSCGRMKTYRNSNDRYAHDDDDEDDEEKEDDDDDGWDSLDDEIMKFNNSRKGLREKKLSRKKHVDGFDGGVVRPENNKDDVDSWGKPYSQRVVYLKDSGKYNTSLSISHSFSARPRGRQHFSNNNTPNNTRPFSKRPPSAGVKRLSIVDKKETSLKPCQTDRDSVAGCSRYGEEKTAIKDTHMDLISHDFMTAKKRLLNRYSIFWFYLLICI